MIISLQPLGFLLIGRVRDTLKMADHLADQHDQRFGRRLQFQQAMQRRIRLALFCKDFRVERRLASESV